MRQLYVNARPDLTAVFLAARECLARPSNDFAWSGWRDMASALREIDELLAKLRAGEVPDRLRMRVLFAPTGPIQEVSINAGWGDEFLALAIQFDLALAELDEPRTG
jgi:hypothetical protein